MTAQKFFLLFVSLLSVFFFLCEITKKDLTEKAKAGPCTLSCHPSIKTIHPFQSRASWSDIRLSVFTQ